MTAKTTATIKSDINVGFPDNTVGAITPAITRSQLKDIADSYLNKADTIDQTVLSVTDFTNGVLSDGQNVFNQAEIALSAESTATQAPGATDAPLQVTFGAAQTNPDVSIDVAGKITYHTTGTYFHSTSFRTGRTGAAAAARLVIAYKLNGAWTGTTTCTLLDTADEAVTVTLCGFLNMNATDYVETFVIRDSTGNNDGGLYSFNPTLAGVLDVPSAKTTIWKMSSI